MGCQPQNVATVIGMPTDIRDRPKLTPKGERTRNRILEAAARLIHEQGVAGTTLEDVRTATDVSGSQLSHYFADKDDLVQAVIDHQADTIVANQQQADIGSTAGLRAWRDMVIAQAQTTDARGGCPLGSLGGQLAETDPLARTLIAAGFDRWSTTLSDGLRNLQKAGHFRTDIDPDELAVTLLAVLQGGLLLAQVHRSPAPIETAVDTFLQLVTRMQS
jgi:TetR/AcrR family transcriptional repressor of nem operon